MFFTCGESKSVGAHPSSRKSWKTLNVKKLHARIANKIMLALHPATRSKQDEEAEKSESPQLKGVFAMNTTYAPLPSSHSTRCLNSLDCSPLVHIVHFFCSPLFLFGKIIWYHLMNLSDTETVWLVSISNEFTGLIKEFMNPCKNATSRHPFAENRWKKDATSWGVKNSTKHVNIERTLL
jgi:hypothetical protein